ncbi:MAG: MFS transporter [Verrucomicrobiia bacterium]
MSDLRLLFATRSLRLFAYGFLAVVLVLYLAALGVPEWRIGLLLTLILAGDASVSLWITTRADRIGRRRMLLLGAGLMVGAGLAFAFTRDFYVLLVAGVLGVISPSGYEVGPFLAIEQAALAHVVPDHDRTRLFAWYNLSGSLATALGSLAGGWLSLKIGMLAGSELAGYRAVVVGYALIGLVLAAFFWRLSPSVEVRPDDRSDDRLTVPRLGLTESRGVVARLSALFALDAFGGGFVVQSLMAYWFHVRFGMDAAALGTLFFGANVLAALSSLAAVWIAKRIGLVNTMVFTHLPSNILLILVPLMPDATSAIVVLLVRFSISQMDVPTRQSYTVAVVKPSERSAAAGITNIARSLGAASAPMLAGPLLAAVAVAGAPVLLVGAPFFLAGGIKIAYDLALWHQFRAVKPPEEQQTS